MSNVLLSDFQTKYELPPFTKIKIDDYKDGIEGALEEARNEVQQIIESKDEPGFSNVIEALEESGAKLQRNASILFNLNSAETSDELQKITQEISPKLSEFNSEVKQNEDLFRKVKAVYNQRDTLGLSTEQKKLLQETYLDFVRRGVELEGDKKERFKEITIELSKLSLSFSENLLAETNDFELVIEDESDLSGLPADVLDRARELARKNGREDAWVFSLQAPSYIPFMEYADNRELREKMYRAFMCKCFKGNGRDNQELVLKIIQLKAELASLLGYPTFGHYVLEQRMAESPDTVLAFLNDLLEKSLPKAKEEVEEIKEFVKSRGVDIELQRWDWAYYSEKLRKEKYELDDELVKPYFKLENVISGAFETAERLFGISFKENTELEVYHKDVKAYEVYDESGKVVSVFLADFFPRDGKRAGAWMTSYRDEKYKDDKRVIPHVSIVCNFTPSSSNHPSLLKFDEVKTLFHEFGHALHGMLADTRYQSLSGTSVYWDFVELPSQIMENWCYEKECLDLFAKHYKTGELIPADLVERIKKSSTYHEAYATVRQISFGLLDMAWHSLSFEEAKSVSDVGTFENESFAPTELFPRVEDTNMSVQFGHIFAGGYAAGYYSYKWAEVLDADAFSVFKENGIFDPATASLFKENILSKGGTEHPMVLYKRFRGHEPKPDALLKRAGLV
ncbi:peptidyl-dipeptidase Dcp [Ekhidna lutea]|uniref:oligopeptidase A n=1 Tax=Ekhidna lutea TaxID=447679 RepID=A0A239HHK0_EKHLU|nr:M3 family metallopeptidase [Ekhidna lutea]SNS80625.1 peptidyl-dipeptidase Dcp [Ekhidna lutea]